MHDDAAGEILCAQLRQPAIGMPDPVADRVINQPAQPVNVEKDSNLQEEFRAAFEFAAKYAGYHASPASSPGAWNAFRQTSKTDDRQNLNDVLNNDCTFLIKRLADKSKGIEKVGDKKSRYQGYARVLPAGESMRLVLDELFLNSLNGKKTVLNVTFFDKGEGEFTIDGLGQIFSVQLTDSNQWRTELFSLEKTDTESPELVIKTKTTDVILHMVELQRGN